MASPEPQVSATLPLEETRVVLELDPLGNQSWPQCAQVMDTTELPVAKPPRMETDASGPEAGDVTTANKLELYLPEGSRSLGSPSEKWLETNQESTHLQFAQNDFEDIRSHWNMREIQTNLETREQCIKFAEDRGLIPTKKMCNYHHRPMSLRRSHLHLGTFGCTKRKCRRRIHSRAAGTWFSNTSMPLSTVFQLMYMYCHQYSYHAAQKASARDDGKMHSASTISYWYTHCRETVIVYHLEHQEAEYKIGGAGKIVHIKQLKIGERKFNSGSRIEGQWVLVMMEAGNDDLRLEVCPDNEESAKMLLPLIVEKHIKVGTEIHTSSWVAYHCLSDHGFVHKNVDASTENGIEELEGTHAEATDSYWSKLKTLYKRYNYKNYADWLVEYSWRQKVKKSHKCPFEELLKAVKYVY